MLNKEKQEAVQETQAGAARRSRNAYLSACCLWNVLSRPQKSSGAPESGLPRADPGGLPC